MALQKAYSPKPGVTGNYWKIEQLEIRISSKDSFIMLHQYASSSDTNGVDPLSVRTYKWQGDIDFPFTGDAMNSNGDNPIAIAYRKIKEVDEDLSDAKDV